MKSTASTARLPIRTSELYILAAVTLCAVGLRWSQTSHLAVEHFDEGVYASNYWFGEEAGYAYPNRHLYAPLLLPFLVEWSVILFGPRGWAPMLPGLVMGTLTVPLIWWVARSWFGPEGGITAATFAAFSDVHLLYSRTALTDVPLCFWTLAAVFCFWKAYTQTGKKPGYSQKAGLLRSRWKWTAATGVATGLAWCTKYNGWLPLAIGLAGAIPWVAGEKLKGLGAESARIGRVILIWISAAVIAVVVWSPVWFGLQSHGGYAAVSENHRGYLVGIAGWFDSLKEQYANHRFLEGWLSYAGVALAIVLGWCVFRCLRDFTWNASTAASSETRRKLSLQNDLRVYTVVMLVLATAFLTGTSAVLAALTIAGCGGLLVTGWTGHRSENPPRPAVCPRTRLACWLTLAWFTGLLLATPFYKPYPRLTLPWLVACWLGASAAVSLWFRVIVHRPGSAPASSAEPGFRTSLVTAIAATLVALVLFQQQHSRLSSRGIPGWEDHTGLKRIAEQVVRSIDRDRQSRRAGAENGSPEFVVRVYGEPPLVFHLFAVNAQRESDFFLVQPVAHLNLPSSDRGSNAAGNRPETGEVPLYLVTGPHAHQDPSVIGRLRELQQSGRLERVEEFKYLPGRLVQLNLLSAGELRRDAVPVTEAVSVYAVR